MQFNYSFVPTTPYAHRSHCQTHFIIHIFPMDNKFKKGLLLGSILGAAALVSFSMTKKGEELSEDLQNGVKELTKKLKKQIAHFEDISKEKYEELVAAVTDEYATKKSLAVDAKDKLVNALKSAWAEMETAYRSEEKDVKAA